MNLFYLRYFVTLAHVQHYTKAAEQLCITQPSLCLLYTSGESTVMGKLLRNLGLFEPLQQKITQGMPVLGTCAGLILLASKLAEDDTVHFGTLPVTVKRNAYGRQLGSFQTVAEVAHIGEIPLTCIRAPDIESAGDGDVYKRQCLHPVQMPRIHHHRYGSCVYLRSSF